MIGRPHGVRGLVRVTSHTADPAGLTAYGPLSDDKGRRFVLRWRGEGRGRGASSWWAALPVKVADRTAAEKLTNTRLYMDRSQLPEPEAEEFYLADLIGLTAVDADGRMLGRVGDGARLRRRSQPGDRAGWRASAAGAVHPGLRAGGRCGRRAGARSTSPTKWERHPPGA